MKKNHSYKYIIEGSNMYTIEYILDISNLSYVE